jgi:hypothetical protein
MVQMIIDAALLAVFVVILLAVSVATGFGVVARLRPRMSQGEQMVEGSRPALSMDESHLKTPPEFLFRDRRETRPVD